MRSWRITSGSCSTDIGGVGTGTDLVAVGSLDNDVLDGGLEGFPSLNVGWGGLSWAIVHRNWTRMGRRLGLIRP